MACRPYCSRVVTGACLMFGRCAAPARVKAPLGPQVCPGRNGATALAGRISAVWHVTARPGVSDVPSHTPRRRPSKGHAWPATPETACVQRLGWSALSQPASQPTPGSDASPDPHQYDIPSRHVWSPDRLSPVAMNLGGQVGGVHTLRWAALCAAKDRRLLARRRSHVEPSQVESRLPGFLVLPLSDFPVGAFPVAWIDGGPGATIQNPSNGG